MEKSAISLITEDVNNYTPNSATKFHVISEASSELTTKTQSVWINFFKRFFKAYTDKLIQKRKNRNVGDEISTIGSFYLDDIKDNFALAIHLPDNIKGSDVDISIALKLVEKQNIKNKKKIGLNLCKNTALLKIFAGYIKVPPNINIEDVSKMPLYFCQNGGEIHQGFDYSPKIKTIIKPMKSNLTNVAKTKIVNNINLKIKLQNIKKTKSLQETPKFLAYKFITNSIKTKDEILNKILDNSRINDSTLIIHAHKDPILPKINEEISVHNHEPSTQSTSIVSPIITEVNSFAYNSVEDSQKKSLEILYNTNNFGLDLSEAFMTVPYVSISNNNPIVLDDKINEIAEVRNVIRYLPNYSWLNSAQFFTNNKEDIKIIPSPNPSLISVNEERKYNSLTSMELSKLCISNEDVSDDLDLKNATIEAKEDSIHVIDELIDFVIKSLSSHKKDNNDIKINEEEKKSTYSFYENVKNVINLKETNNDSQEKDDYNDLKVSRTEDIFEEKENTPSLDYITYILEETISPNPICEKSSNNLKESEDETKKHEDTSLSEQENTYSEFTYESSYFSEESLKIKKEGSQENEVKKNSTGAKIKTPEAHKIEINTNETIINNTNFSKDTDLKLDLTPLSSNTIGTNQAFALENLSSNNVTSAPSYSNFEEKSSTYFSYNSNLNDKIDDSINYSFIESFYDMRECTDEDYQISNRLKQSENFIFKDPVLEKFNMYIKDNTYISRENEISHNGSSEEFTQTAFTPLLFDDDELDDDDVALNNFYPPIKITEYTNNDTNENDIIVLTTGSSKVSNSLAMQTTLEDFWSGPSYDLIFRQNNLHEIKYDGKNKDERNYLHKARNLSPQSSSNQSVFLENLKTNQNIFVRENHESLNEANINLIENPQEDKTGNSKCSSNENSENSGVKYEKLINEEDDPSKEASDDNIDSEIMSIASSYCSKVSLNIDQNKSCNENPEATQSECKENHKIKEENIEKALSDILQASRSIKDFVIASDYCGDFEGFYKPEDDIKFILGSLLEATEKSVLENEVLINFCFIDQQKNLNQIINATKLRMSERKKKLLDINFRKRFLVNVYEKKRKQFWRQKFPNHAKVCQDLDDNVGKYISCHQVTIDNLSDKPNCNPNSKSCTAKSGKTTTVSKNNEEVQSNKPPLESSCDQGFVISSKSSTISKHSKKTRQVSPSSSEEEILRPKFTKSKKMDPKSPKVAGESSLSFREIDDMDYDADYESSSTTLPEFKNVRNSSSELNSNEEILKIEDNVRTNDLLDRLNNASKYEKLLMKTPLVLESLQTIVSSSNLESSVSQINSKEEDNSNNSNNSPNQE